jgi:CheY-like chemotaxis protein/DNA-binding MarR family transcriptional regulator
MGTGARRVLIIDDDRRILQIFERVLERAGFSCTTASDPEHVIELLQKHPDIGVILTDLLMPGLNGVELMRQIRGRFASRPWLQLIVITGNATLESAIDSLRLEAAEYLQKPVAAADLVQVVTRAAMRAETLRLLNLNSGTAQVVGSLKDVADLAGKLAGQMRGDEGVAATPVVSADNAEQLLRLIWQIQAARREVFPEDRLPEASWEMLSELMSLEFAGRRITVGGLCLAASCPVTTALRRIDELVELGLILKEQDPADARRQHVRLTDPGRLRMEHFLTRVSSELGSG